jgi:hypothetical protein
MRTSHTTQQGKAKCLMYRDGKRCGRVAKHVITTKRGVSGVTWSHAPACNECCHEWVENRGAALVQQSNPSGFRVISQTLSEWTSRTYVPIER